jgi:hypothetical protein
MLEENLMSISERLNNMLALMDKYPSHFANAAEANRLPPLPEGYKHTYLEIYLGNQLETPYLTAYYTPEKRVFLSGEKDGLSAVQIFDAQGDPCLIAVEGHTLTHRLQNAPLPEDLLTDLLSGVGFRLDMTDRLTQSLG